MKSLLLARARACLSLAFILSFGLGSSALAQNQTVNGNLSATGTLDIDGNQASFGTEGSNAGYFFAYTSGNPATVNLTATSAGANWIWSEGAGGTLKTQLKLSNTNTLSLFNPSTGVASVFLNPAGTSSFIGGITVNGVPVLTTTGNGSGLTGLNASQLTTGTVSAALLPSSVVQTTATQTLTNKTLDGTTLTGTTVLGGGSSAQQVAITSTGAMGIGTANPQAQLQVAGDGYALFGPNSSWGQSLRIGGNGNPTNNASVVTTNGNLHLDAEASSATYLNYYRGAGGVNFGNGAGGVVGSVSSAGDLSMGTGTFGGNVGIGATASALAPNWKGAEVAGQNGLDKIVTGPLVSTYTGATVAAHVSALNAWADLNMAGANLIFRTNGETEVARLTSSGKLGIGTTTPAAKLDVAGDVNIQGNLTVTGTSVSLPNQTLSGGTSILTQGLADARYLKNTAPAGGGFNIGGQTAQGSGSIAMSDGNAYGNYSTAMGAGYALAVYSTAMSNGYAYGDSSTAMSNGYTAGDFSTAMGGGLALGYNSTAINSGTANGILSMAVGLNTTANGLSQIVVGHGNIPQGDSNNPLPDDDLFIIGNGGPRFYSNVWEFMPSNAFVIKENGNMWVGGDSTLTGNVGIGTSAPAAKLDVAGDARVRGALLIPPSGDLSMGTFVAGTNPAQ